MSKADMLGESATFDAVAQPISSRAAAFARFANPEASAAASTSEVPESGRLPLLALAHNPYNPREELKEVEELADSLAARGVIQPLTVVTRAAFLLAHPGHEEALADAQYVVVDGNRRLAAANQAGLDDVPVHVDDSFAEDADTLLETALIAAVQHESLDPLDEAKALHRLVGVHGSQRAVARALGKSSGWVTQRMALLKLTPDLKQAVEDRTLPVEVARRVGQMPSEQQEEAANLALAERREKKERRPAPPQGAYAVSTPAPPQGAYGVSTPATAVPPARPSEDLPTTRETAFSAAVQEEPLSAEPHADHDDADGSAPGDEPWVMDIRKLPRVPWNDGDAVADLVFEKMDEAQRGVLLERLLAAHGQGN
ncbi:ParB/RepB/Spo0J family partition protein [Streptomyces sp. NPDC058646]|uniref:ParB/RepB/Spo0J family partition protein n=1 Tax=Streptomyces sp. NPDC058646 TaxID=3346574 RepID=UPI0036622AF7